MQNDFKAEANSDDIGIGRLEANAGRLDICQSTSHREKPYWPDAVLKRHILPAAERAGITKRIGWHSSRRTLATLLESSGASVKTTRELMRQASPGITMGVYAKAVTADKRQAQDAIAALFVGSSNQSVDAATA